MGETGPHIAILVLCALARLNLVVSSTIPASCASVSDYDFLWDDRGEPPRIKVIDQGLSDFFE